MDALTTEQKLELAVKALIDIRNHQFIIGNKLAKRGSTYIIANNALEKLCVVSALPFSKGESDEF